MAQKRMIQVILKLQKSKIYRRLEAFVEFFENGVLALKLLRKIKKRFIILKRRINGIIRRMRLRGVPDGTRMYFYRLVRKFLPAFVKAWNIDI